jgi:hypothetical protein
MMKTLLVVLNDAGTEYDTKRVISSPRVKIPKQAPTCSGNEGMYNCWRR